MSDIIETFGNWINDEEYTQSYFENVLAGFDRENKEDEESERLLNG